MLTLQAQGDLHLGVEDHLASSLTTGESRTERTLPRTFDSPSDKRARRGQGDRKWSALHASTNFSVSRCLGSSSGSLNECSAWSSSCELWSWGPLGAYRSGPWRWLLQEKPPPQTRSLRVCTWVSLRGEWSLREKREVVDR